jgi:hypothetical protein
MDGLIGLFKRKAKEGGSITVRFDVICVQWKCRGGNKRRSLRFHNDTRLEQVTVT